MAAPVQAARCGGTCKSATAPLCPQTDPEAAKVVFGCGAALTMVPLEVTHTALATPEVMGRIAPRDSAFLRLMLRLLTFFAHSYRDVFSFAHPPLHDPLAVFAVACPSAFKVGMACTLQILHALSTVCSSCLDHAGIMDAAKWRA